MTIEEMKNEKKLLEKGITSSLIAFTKKTSLDVDGIRLIKIGREYYRTLISVEVEVKL